MPMTVFASPTSWRVLLIAPVSLALLSACSAQTAEEEAAAEQEVAGEETAAADGKTPEPREFAGTAWRSMAEDGARFVTYIDAGGTYRDLRNGDSFQQGAWTWNADGFSRKLCFTPEADGGVERCWSVSPVEDGVMIVTGLDDKQVELERVDYVLPGNKAENGEG